jgi:hypothetical protein
VRRILSLSAAVAALVAVTVVEVRGQDFVAEPGRGPTLRGLLAVPEDPAQILTTPGQELLEPSLTTGQPWDVNFTLGGDTNSNVPSFGDRFSLRDKADTRRSASADIATGGHYLWRLTSMDTLIGACGMGFTSYVHLPQWDQQNYNCVVRLDHTVTPDLVATAQVNDQVTVLDGDLFRNRPEVKVGAAYRVLPPLVVEGEYALSDSDYYFPVPLTQVQDRDTVTHAVGATGHFKVPGTQLRGQLGYQHLTNEADGSDWDSSGHRVTAMLSHPIVWGVVGEATYRFGSDSYDHVNSLSGFTRERADTLQSIVVRLTRSFPMPGFVKGLVPSALSGLLPKTLKGYVRYEYNDRDSNVRFFTSHANVFKFGISTSQK